MNTLISVCSILLITVKTNAAVTNIHVAALSPNMQPESMNHVINKRSPEVVSAKKGCIDGCVSAEHQKSKISEIEPDVKDAKDEADQDKSVSHTTSVQLLVEENSKTVVEQEIVEDNESRPKNKNAPCVAAAAFIESLLSSQESKQSKESILEELYEYYDQLKNSSSSSDEQYEVDVDEVREFKNVSSQNSTVPKKSHLDKNVSEPLYHANESVKVDRPEVLPLYTESDSEESSPLSSEESTTDSSEFSSDDSTSSEHSLPPHTEGKIVHRIKTTRVTKTQKVSKILPVTTENSTVSEEQTASTDDSSLYTTESLAGANDSTTNEISSVTETPLEVSAHVSIVLKEKDKSPKKSNSSSVIRETKIEKYFHVPDDDSDSSNKNITQIASLADIELVTEELSNSTDRNVAVVDINVTLTEKEISRNDTSTKRKPRVTDTVEELVQSTRSKPTETVTDRVEESMQSTSSKPKQTVTEESLQSTTTTELPVVNATTEKSKRNRLKNRVKEVKDLACINRLSSKYPFLKLLFQKNGTNVVQSPAVFVPIPLNYIPQISNSHLPPDSSSSLETKQKSCKRLRVLIAKILEALSKLDVPVESLIKATKSKDSKRQARDIRQQLLSQVSNLSAKDIED